MLSLKTHEGATGPKVSTHKTIQEASNLRHNHLKPTRRPLGLKDSHVTYTTKLVDLRPDCLLEPNPGRSMSKVRTLKHSRKIVRRLTDNFFTRNDWKWGRRDSSAVTSTRYRGPRFGSQSLHSGSQLSVNFSSRGYWALFWHLWAVGMHTMHIHTKAKHSYNIK